MAGENEWDWSTTAAINSAADSSIGWAEGQDPATVNNSARSMMAARAKARNLQSGSITTGGSGNAQTVLSGLGFSTVPTGLCIRVKIGFTNTASTTLNVDTIGAVTIKDQSGSNLAGGELLLNSYCDFRYDGTNWVLLTPTRHPASTFSAGITATTGTFSGAVSMTALTATTGTFSGAVSMTGLTATTGTFSSDVTVTGTLGSGALSATTGTFSSTLAATGRITGSAGVTVGGTLTAATTGAFSGNVQAATFVSAQSATSGTYYFGSNLADFITCDGATYTFGPGNILVQGAGTFSGNVTTGGSLVAASSATAGTIYFGSNLADFITCDGATYTFGPGNISVAGAGSFSGDVAALSYITSSDERLKEDLRPVIDPGAIIEATEVHDFRWKESGKRSFGVMAQHAINVIPTAVHVENDRWGVDYTQYVPILLAEVKELRARLAALEAA